MNLGISDILVVGTVAFYVFVVLAAAITFLVCYLIEELRWGWAAVLLTVSLVVMAQIGVFNLYHAAITNPWLVLECVLASIGTGMAWATFKWWRFVKDEYNRYVDARAKFLRLHNAKTLTDDLKVTWKEILDGRKILTGISTRVSSNPPEASQHKEQIITWMVYWPFSMLATVFSDWVRRFFESLYDMMGGLFNTISQSVFRSASADVE